MNDDEKAILKVGAETAMKPIADLMTKLFGGPVEQIGGMWTDSLKVRRQIRQIKLLNKLHLAIEAAGFEPRTIPDKSWVPMIQAALLEDEESLQTAWANLLANAADPRQPPIELTFTRMLSELSSREVRFLDLVYKSGQGKFQSSLAGWHQKYLASKMLPDVVPHFSGPPVMNADQQEEFGIIMNILVGLRILAENGGQTVDGSYRFSPLGIAFVRVCQPPPKS